MLNTLTGRQIEILHAMRTDGMALEDIASLLATSRQAAQKHLDHLLHAGLAASGETKQTGGRPRQLYRLTPQGQELFPRQYAWFTEILIGFLKEAQGTEALSALLRKLAKTLAAKEGAALSGMSRRARIEAITHFMNKLGYAASVNGASEIVATNCVYHHIAQAHSEICSFDIQLLETLSGGKIEHTECMVRGGSCCRFRLKKDSKKSRP